MQVNIELIKIAEALEEQARLLRKMAGVPDAPIEDLELTCRSTNALKEIGIGTLYEMIAYPLSDFERRIIASEWGNKKVLKEILDMVKLRGVVFRPE